MFPFQKPPGNRKAQGIPGKNFFFSTLEDKISTHCTLVRQFSWRLLAIGSIFRIVASDPTGNKSLDLMKISRGHIFRLLCDLAIMHAMKSSETACT